MTVALVHSRPSAAAVAAQIPVGVTRVELKCFLCGERAAVAFLPPSPPAPVELRAIVRPIVGWFARKAPIVKIAVDHLLDGNMPAAVDSLTAAAGGATIIPIACEACVSANDG